MPYIELSQQQQKNKTIMIFTEGTVLVPKSIWGLFSFASYIPCRNCVEKIKEWQLQGAEIVYFTSRKSPNMVSLIAELLKKYGFPGTKLYYRESRQHYHDIVEQVMPDVLIEDDCKSIGGSWQMCITYVKPELKSKIKSIVVKEYRGIGHLPDHIAEL